MNELHLLEYCTLLGGIVRVSLAVCLSRNEMHLAGFTSSEEKHLDFVASLGTVALELMLNLIISCASRVRTSGFVPRSATGGTT